MVRSPITTGVVVLLGISLLAATVSLTIVAGGPLAQTAGANTSVTQSPGTQFAGVVATEGATLENEQHRRTLKVSLRRARTPSMQAAVIAKTTTSLDRQLDSLEARSARLTHAQRTGRIEQDQYRAESTVLTTNIRGIERRIELLRDAAARLSNAQLEAHGSSLNDVTRLAERAQTLRENNEGRSTDSNTDDDDDSSEETDTPDNEETDTPDNEETDTPDNDDSSDDDASAMKWGDRPGVGR